MDFSKKLMEEQGYGNNVTDVKYKVIDTNMFSVFLRPNVFHSQGIILLWT